MKKKIFFFTLCFTFLLASVCFAYNPLADSRWQYLTNNNSTRVYCDTQSITYFDDGFTIWLCHHDPNDNPKKERYHFSNLAIGSSNRTFFVIADRIFNGNGKLIDSYDKPTTISTIYPNSLAELILNKFRRR